MTIKGTGLKAGIFTGVLMILYVIYIQWVQEQIHQAANSLLFVVQGIGIYYSYSEFKKNHAGLMTYRQGIRLGLWTSLFAGLLLGIYYYIDVEYNGNTMLQDGIAMQRKAMEKDHVPAKQIEESMALVKQYMKPVFLIPAAILSNLFTGFLLSMVLASFMQRNPVEKEGQF